MRKPEYRLKAGDSSDRGVTKLYAVETDKGYLIGRLSGETLTEIPKASLEEAREILRPMGYEIQSDLMQ